MQQWVRSGKATGQPFEERHSQHKKGAELKTAVSQNSKFYSSYPKIGIEYVSDTSRRGWFDHLTQHIAVGIPTLGSSSFPKEVIISVESGGFFSFQGVQEKINNLQFGGCDQTKIGRDNKILHMLGYMWELSYELCLSPSFDVSESFGFELALGNFGGRNE